jgi:UPF0271 protein
MRTIDLNCDLGEGFGNYIAGPDVSLLKHISSCSIACGYHAGDPLIIQSTIKEALKRNISIGAHPSYPDRQGFGRRSMRLNAKEHFAFVLYQVSAIKGMVESQGGQLKHVKPHGALYNDAALDENITRNIYEAISSIDEGLCVYGLSNTAHEHVANELGISFISEAFADRKYHSDGTLVARFNSAAILENTEEVIQQVMSLIHHQEVVSVEGQKVNIPAKTICFHGDHPQTLPILKEVHKTLLETNIEIKLSI